MKIVISLGGSLLTRELTSENFKRYGDVLLRLKEGGHKIVAVCGGGSTARDYQRIARESGASKELQHWVGIVATQLNAMTLISVLGKENAHRNVLRTKEQVRRALNEKILVCGGNLPGCSTDYDAALFAEALRADLLINATNIDGVYSSDPKKDPKAKKFDRLSYGEFERIISKNPQLPGGYGLFDLKGVEIIRRARIKMVVIDGTNPEEIVRAVEGRHSGTVIE